MPPPPTTAPPLTSCRGALQRSVLRAGFAHIVACWSDKQGRHQVLSTCKHGASAPVWLARAPTSPALPQPPAAAAQPATRGGAVATFPID